MQLRTGTARNGIDADIDVGQISTEFTDFPGCAANSYVTAGYRWGNNDSMSALVCNFCRAEEGLIMCPSSTMLECGLHADDACCVCVVGNYNSNWVEEVVNLPSDCIYHAFLAHTVISHNVMFQQLRGVVRQLL